MTESTNADRHEAALRQVQAEMTQAGKREAVEIFAELLERLWERLNSLIGETATAAIFRSAVVEASRDRVWLEDVTIADGGISLDQLDDSLETIDRAALRAGLLALTDNVMTLLIDLTGEILLRKVEPLVEQFKQKLDEA